MEEDIRIYEAFSSMAKCFNSIYYINLEENSFFAPAQTEAAASTYTNEGNYEELIQVLSTAIIHPGDQELYRRMLSISQIRQSLKDFGYQEFEYRSQMPDGTYHWLRNQVVLSEQDRQGNPLKVTLFTTDIDDTKTREFLLAQTNRQAEEMLEVEQARIRLLADSSDALVCTYDTKQDFMQTLVNITLPDGTVEHRSVERHNLRTAWKEIIHPEEYEEIMELLTSGTRLGEELEVRIRPEGEDVYHWYKVISKGVYRESMLRQVILVMTDINDLKMNQESAKTYEELCNFAVQNHYELLSLIDIRTRAYEIYAIEDEMWRSLPRRGLYEEATRQLFKEHAFETLQNSPMFCLKDLDFMLQEIQKTSNGIYSVVFPVEDLKSLIYKKLECQLLPHDPDKMVMLVSDVTERYQKEEELKEARRAAEAASEAKSSFLSNMSHDIRTPMNAIMGMTAIAEANIGNTERLKDCLGKIASSSHYLLSLINDVLDMSRIESGRMTLTESDFSIAEFIENLKAIIYPQARASGQQFEIHTRHIVHEKVRGDMLRINQVIINILSNALKFTPAGGRIELYVEEGRSSRPGYARYLIRVTDTGRGMSPEFIANVFEPFSRERDSIANRIQGTGLGMSIAKNIVDIMGGSISVQSKPGEGTTFFVDFELHLQDEQTDYERYRDIRVLVVDDEADICGRVTECLNHAGMHAGWQLSGEAAVRAAEETYAAGGRYDVILLDWKMPEMDGVETARRLRGIVPEDTPILVLTAYDWSEIREEAEEAGIDAFLSKPFFLSAFCTVLDTYYRKIREEGQRQKIHDSFEYRGRHFLMAEDNELNAEILVELLGMQGAHVDVAVNGAEVVQRFKGMPEHTYDAVFMDIQMPVMNGYQAANAIRGLKEREDAKTVPIIAMTANAFAEDIEKALAAGMNTHVCKPVDMNLLGVALSRLLG